LFLLQIYVQFFLWRLPNCAHVYDVRYSILEIDLHFLIKLYEVMLQFFETVLVSRTFSSSGFVSYILATKRPHAFSKSQQLHFDFCTLR